MGAEKKKINIRIIILHILSVLAVNAFIYAGFTMLRSVIFDDDGGATAIILYAVSICFAHAVGILSASANPMILNRIVRTKFIRFFTFMLNIRDSERFISSMAVWGLIIIPAAVTFSAYGSLGLGRCVFELLPAVAAYIISVKHSRLTPAQIMSSASLFTGMTIMVICLELPYLVSSLMYLRPYYFAASYFLIFAFLITKNQEDIERQIFSKKHIDKSVLPRNLRRFNAMSTFFIFILTMLLFNFKKVVMYLLDIAKLIIQLAVSLFMWLLEKLVPEVSPRGESMQNSMNMVPGQRPMPLFNFVINVLVYFVILYAAYKLIFAVVIRTPAAISRILAMLRKLFKINSDTSDAGESDFIDTTETVLPDVRNTAVNTKRKKAKAKKLEQIIDPVEKVRHMYGNILGVLPLHGIKTDKADTVNEILAKAAGAVEVQEGLSPFTSIYEQVRYGEIIPDSDMLSRAEKCYREIC